MQAKQRGVTLIELMIALVLGSLIIAAGLSIFLSAQRSIGLQGSMRELQENANFGLSLLMHDVRHTNLNTKSNQRINSKVEGSGIIFSAANMPANLTLPNNFATDLVTLSSKDKDGTNEDQISSDRLSIQFMPSTSSYVDCEGNVINNADQRVIIQRYYVKETSASGQPKSYSLMCDAASYLPNGSDLQGLDTRAQQVMQNIEAFKIRFGVKGTDGQGNLNDNAIRYMTLPQYLAAVKAVDDNANITNKNINYPNIMSIEVGILAKASSTLSSGSETNTTVNYILAGQPVTLDTQKISGTDSKLYLRQAINQVIAFRNTLGAS